MPPQVGQAALSREILLRGQDLVVTWSVQGATKVRITGPDGLDVTVPTSGTGVGSAVVTPRASGSIMVVAENRHGLVELRAGQVDLYDLPPFSVDNQKLPRTTVPRLPRVDVPEVFATPPTRPLVDTAMHQVPRVDFPELLPVLDAIRPAMRATDVVDVLAAATSRVTDALLP